MDHEAESHGRADHRDFAEQEAGAKASAELSELNRSPGFLGALSARLSQTDTSAAAIFVDEFDAGSFKGQ